MRAEFDETLVTGNEMIDGQHKPTVENESGRSSKIAVPFTLR